jgi:hypothetical protein
MIMMDQSKRLSEPLRWGRREKTVIAVLLSCVVLGVAGLSVLALSGGGPMRKDCVSASFASTLGGAEIHACGQNARLVCASSAHRSIASQLRVACRRAGFPFGGG